MYIHKSNIMTSNIHVFCKTNILKAPGSLSADLDPPPARTPSRTLHTEHRRLEGRPVGIAVAWSLDNPSLSKRTALGWSVFRSFGTFASWWLAISGQTAGLNLIDLKHKSIEA